MKICGSETDSNDSRDNLRNSDKGTHSPTEECLKIRVISGTLTQVVSYNFALRPTSLNLLAHRPVSREKLQSLKVKRRHNALFRIHMTELVEKEHTSKLVHYVE